MGFYTLGLSMDQLGSNIWLVVTLLNGAGPDPTLVRVSKYTWKNPEPGRWVCE